MAERISFVSINPLEVVPYIKAGKLRALAAMDKQVSPLLPSVPTVVSLGLPNSTATVWWGLVGPKGMPQDVVSELNAALRESLADPEVQRRFADMGAKLTPTTAAEFGTFVDAEIAKWGKLIKVKGIGAD